MSRVEAVLKAQGDRYSQREKENREVWTVQGRVHPG